MPRSKSSQRWLREHFSDPFVQRAQAEGLRSRAAYKLEELIERDRILKPGMVVVDLGAAPGGWAQVVARRLAGKTAVIALDILPMPAIPGVIVLEGDFRDPGVLHRLEAEVAGRAVDLVLSDMAPNMSGVASVDQARSMELVELARDFAQQHLAPGGAFLVKLFQGAGFDAYLKDLRTRYARVTMRKPEASRARSPEVYALCTGFKGNSAARL
ncbi:MAG: 23S rRNA (uridine(2552)-2'-O)-methyltransferase RlmE [Pseudomonadota bacterium]|jgi:23S rRNA (uridine2552-2'-O)-methyltransferase